MSAFTPKADIPDGERDVRFVPKADVCPANAGIMPKSGHSSRLLGPGQFMPPC
ncbi:MAG: hypothetical protein WAM76_03895 [Pseudolabrys sp.]